MKLANNWKRFGPVFEHESGMRVHTLGFLVFPSKQVLMGNQMPEYDRLNKAIKIQGGNRKRGLMLWAESVWQAALEESLS